jgi:hypothetical protein
VTTISKDPSAWPPENPQTDEEKAEVLAYVLRTFNFDDKKLGDG